MNCKGEAPFVNEIGDGNSNGRDHQEGQGKYGGSVQERASTKWELK